MRTSAPLAVYCAATIWAFFVLGSFGAQAQDKIVAQSGNSWRLPWLNEVRAGILYHEDSRVKRLIAGSSKGRESGFLDIQFEMLSTRPGWRHDNSLVDFLLRPRLQAGATLNLGGGTSLAFLGLAWDHTFYKSLFIEGSFGGALHDGSRSNVPKPGKRNLGCNPLFRQGLSLGLNVTDHWRVMASVEHFDNFGLCDQNAGLTNIGLRAGYRF